MWMLEVQARIQSGVRGVNAHPGGGPCVMHQFLTIIVARDWLPTAHLDAFSEERCSAV